MANKKITTVDTVELNSNESFFINQNNTIKQVSKANVIESIVNSFSDEGVSANVKSNLGLGQVATLNVVPITNGGTGASNAATARSNLDLGDVATEDIVPIKKGGTGADDGTTALKNMFAAGGTVLTKGLQYGTVGDPNTDSNGFPQNPTSGQIYFLKLT